MYKLKLIITRQNGKAPFTKTSIPTLHGSRYKEIGVSPDHIIQLNINFMGNVQRLPNVKFNHRLWLVTIFQILASNNKHFSNTHGERLKKLFTH